MWKESDELMEEARALMTNVLDNCIGRGCSDWGKNQIHSEGFLSVISHLEKDETPSHDTSHHYGSSG